MKEDEKNDMPVFVKKLSELNSFHKEGWWIENNLNVMREKLALVESLVYRPVTNKNFNTAIRAIHFMVDKIPLMINYMDPVMIVRARPNYGELFSEQADISYNSKNPEKISAGRFNRPLEPLFYGALAVDNPKTDNVLASTLECCKELQDDERPPAVQDITIGRWFVTQSFPVVNLCFDEKHLAGNKGIKDATEMYLSELKTFFSNETYKFILQFMKFFSELSCSIDESKNYYYILNAFFFAIRYYYAHTRNTPIPGIIYPSAMTGAQGLNIVLVPQAVDRFLYLDLVVMYRFVLVKSTKQYVADICSNFVPVKNKKFTITGFHPSGDKNRVFYY
ncbi:MAG TPA: hypothetical protein VK671_13330 [Mucilaginibacter sp.]|jgi:hypothetical protein|nr:hypothetical protein [Mucilaginibacter sp.]